MISVITPSIRKEGLAIVEKSLANQTYRDFEWLVGSPFEPTGIACKWVNDDFTGGYWTLNRIQTKLCKEAQGDLLVFWQDCIYGLPTALEKFYVCTQVVQSPITGVGDQYSQINEYGKPINKVWADPRKTDKYGSFYECADSADWELNFASCPKTLIEQVDYFVDQADFEGYGADNVLLAYKLEQQGVRFYIDQTNESFTIRHGRERSDWDTNYIMSNGGFEKLKAVI